MFDLLRELSSFCNVIFEGQYLPGRKWGIQMAYGLTVGGSTLLARVGETLYRVSGGSRDAIDSYAAYEKYLSRGLNAERFDRGRLEDNLLAYAARFVAADDGDDVVIAVDYTDFSKPYTDTRNEDGMEGICQCWDGSEGEQGPGYPVVQIEASIPTKRGPIGCPLIYHPFSYVEAGWRSNPATFKAQIERAAAIVGKKAWWTFDRGFDSSAGFACYDEIGISWIVRLQVTTKKPRHLTLANGDRDGADVLARRLSCTYELTHYSLSGKKMRLRLGIAHVIGIRDSQTGGSPWVGCAYTLVVVKGMGKEPLTLLVSGHQDLNRESAVAAFERYRRRWFAETATRAMKDSRGWGLRLEDVRALKLEGVRRIASLSNAVYLFFAALQVHHPDAVEALCRRVTAPGELPPDLRYRLLRAIGAELSRLPKQDLWFWFKTARAPKVTGSIDAAAEAAIRARAADVSRELRRAPPGDAARLLSLLTAQRDAVEGALKLLLQATMPYA